MPTPPNGPQPNRILLTHTHTLKVDPRRKEPEKPERFPVRLPVIETQTGQIDVLSRLLKDRILLLGQQVDDEVANVLVAQLLYLAQEDKEKDITLYINSPGGSVSAGMAIYDAMQFVPCDVSTVCFGMAASMGAFLLGAGARGKRRSLPNARIMIHQPLGGAQGQAADIEIQAKEILFVRALLNSYISEYTGQPVEKIQVSRWVGRWVCVRACMCARVCARGGGVPCCCCWPCCIYIPPVLTLLAHPRHPSTHH